MKDMAGDVVELLDKLEWTEDRSVHLVGHSMGGMMIQEIVSGDICLDFQADF